MLSNAQLTAIRAMQARSMTDTATITRPALASDGMGGQKETPAVVGDVACRVGPGKTVERIIGERLSSVTVFPVVLPYGTDIRAGDRLTVGGRTFEMIGPEAGHTFETAKRIECVEVA